MVPDHGSLGLVVDLAGVGLAVSAISWTFAAAALSGGDPGPKVALFLVCALVLVAARMVGALRPSVVPAALVAAASVLFLLSPRGVISASPLSGPFGYANAKAAFFTQAAIAGLVLVAVGRRRSARALGLLAAGAFALVPFASRSTTAAILVLLLPAAALALEAGWGTRTAVAVIGCAFGVVLLVTMVLGATYSSSGRPRPSGGLFDPLLTERRVALWHDALLVLEENPVSGVGPGRFGAVSSAAQADPDERWAHQEFLQYGAETGVPGLILLLLVFVWGFVRLWLSAAGVVTVLGAAALGALGMHASLDYILHFPGLPIAAAALVGAGLRAPARRRPP